MADVRKVPAYVMERGVFSGKVWKEYRGASGAVPIDTAQTISNARPAPGAALPPKAPKPTQQQLKAQQAAEAQQNTILRLRKQQADKQLPKQSAPKVLEAEEHEKIPEFDLQDIPGAMERLGWPVSALVARKWFSGSRHVYNDQPNSLQPIDDTSVTLKWALKFGSVKAKFDELLAERIYSARAVASVKAMVAKKVRRTFLDQKSANLSFDTTPFMADLRQFHIDWEFQFIDVTTANTLDGLHMTDLTGTLGNFNIYAALGFVELTAEKFFDYDKVANTKAYCIDSQAVVTHVYVYVKDNYSFNDKNSGASQYLGHWNKKDMILSYRAAVSNLVDGDVIHTRMGNSTITETKYNWDYLPPGPIDKPVDRRTGLVRKLIEKDVYYPVYNRSYAEWREKHNRGGDYMIYSKPQLYKLSKPITIKLDRICRPSEPI